MKLFSSYIVQVHPDFQEFSDFINTIPDRMARQEGSLIYLGRNEIREIEYKGVKFVIKSFHRPNLINRFVYGIFRASKAERSFQNAIRLLAIGVGTPQPVAFINMKKHGLFDRSYYISLHSACSHVSTTRKRCFRLSGGPPLSFTNMDWLILTMDVAISYSKKKATTSISNWST